MRDESSGPTITTPASASPHTCKPLTLSDNSSHKTLGIGWLNGSDEFCFNTDFEFDSNLPITKRIIFSHASQIFDPLDILSPFILTAKMLLQQLWLLKLEWDDTVPSVIAHQWNRFLTSLPLLKTIRVPRCVLSSNITYTEMHTFTDASQTAYGACIYIPTVNANDNKVTVRLICSKGMVAPLKTISIPRLELLGALVDARLYDKIINSLHLNFNHIMFWSDSTIVVACENLMETPTHKLDRYQRVEQIGQHFWTRWTKEYISELQTRTKWRNNIKDFKPNTMVIIKEDNFPPLKWHVGRIVKNIPGNDGISRVADIATASGIVRLAYNNICPSIDPDE
ncbi:uncharacterized protein LOC126780058 [Nymphalis io]|uniref:uncharacterized protein LOC126780058 n=1 Tax=Inachis io TaxID=171585 RepID=UPI00216910B8|nr:uncharacterized protein LOC126780058 [Nymphalis io]